MRGDQHHPKPVCERKRITPAQTLMSMEQNAMYPSNETSWECDAIAWTSESDTESQIEEKQCTWKLKK